MINFSNMNRTLIISLIAIFLSGCSDTIPEYTPFFGEPNAEDVIITNKVPRIADDGTIWAVSDSQKKVYWLKNGVIKSLPIFANYDWVDHYETLDDKFFYMQRNRLLMHAGDSSVLIETPNFSLNDYGYYSIRSTGSNLILMKEESRNYWALTESGWVEHTIPSSASNYQLNYYDFDSYGLVRDSYILFTEPYTIFNLITGQYVSFNPSFQDEWGGNVTAEFQRQCFDSNGNAYGVAGERLVRLNRGNGTGEIIPINIPNVNNPRIKQVRVSKNDDIWVVFTDQELPNIYAYKLGSNIYSSTNYWSGGGSSYDHRKLFADSQGRLWFFDYILEMHRENGQVESYEPIPNNFDYYYHNTHSNTIMKEDETGAIWFGQFNSSLFLFRYKDGTWTNFSNFFQTESN